MKKYINAKYYRIDWTITNDKNFQYATANPPKKIINLLFNWKIIIWK